jgi:hypothetical protein
MGREIEMSKIAVFSCMGLGDGLITLVLSHNLQKNGHAVTTFHPFLQQLQGWFPHLPLAPIPEIESLASYDRFFLFWEKSPQMLKILSYLETHHKEKLTVINPIATPNRDYPYWEEARFDGKHPLVDNLNLFCKNILNLETCTKNNGIILPEGVAPRKYPKRVILHPTSSRPGKNWPKEKYLTLSAELKKRGFSPCFILTPEEKKEWTDVDAPPLASLDEMARYVVESGYMIGNDSGIGHLASLLGLPTVTICRNRETAAFWRPAWSSGAILYPPAWVPNLKGLRWRDKHWKKWVGVGRVLKAFLSLSGN